MVDVSYYYPRCGAVAELDRDPYLADKSVTPFPLEGWTYVSPAEDGAERSSAESASGDKPRAYESEDADGVKFVCGTDAADWSHPPESSEDGEAVDGEEVGGQPESEYVQLAEGMAPSGPQGPNGPEFSR
ncbi:hypothetical protein [Halobacterium noricense]|uniref:hypothetical protein n=1 Tax=Halobacterium noricense TaxID=223182 RepID=UPI001E4B07F5|nr:hypothetical protein [Halobacterium noricense]UHH24422.1 hypothetical protein LT974_10520 [Halobacterium noricense]